MTTGLLGKMINRRFRIFLLPAALAMTAIRPDASLATVRQSVSIEPAPQPATPRPNDPGSIIWPPLDQPLDLRGGYRQQHRVSQTRAGQAKTGGQAPSQPTRPQLSESDCVSAGAFILAGAQARDRGVTALAFMSRLRADLLKLGAEPPETRWFLHSEREARLLHSAARDIFARPQPPASHRRQFMARCDAIRTSDVTGSRD